MCVCVVFVTKCLYSAVSLTLVREQRFIRIYYYYYYYYYIARVLGGFCQYYKKAKKLQKHPTKVKKCQTHAGVHMHTHTHARTHMHTHTHIHAHAYF